MIILWMLALIANSIMGTVNFIDHNYAWFAGNMFALGYGLGWNVKDWIIKHA